MEMQKYSRFHWVISGVITALFLLMGGLGYMVFSLQQELFAMRGQVQVQTVQSPPAVGYPGASDSLVHEYDCTPAVIEDSMAVYRVSARLKSFTEGDQVSFLSSRGGKSELVAAESENGIVFTAELRVPSDTDWSLDLVVDHQGTRTSERLQDVPDYLQLMSERWGTPMLEGSSDYMNGGERIMLNNTVTLPLPESSLEAVGISEAWTEVRVNGEVFRSFPMEWDPTTPDGMLVARCGRVEVPLKDGDALETVVKVRGTDGREYGYLLENYKRLNGSLEFQDIGMSAWQPVQ